MDRISESLGRRVEVTWCARLCGIGHMAGRRTPETYSINDKTLWRANKKTQSKESRSNPTQFRRNGF